MQSDLLVGDGLEQDDADDTTEQDDDDEDAE